MDYIKRLTLFAVLLALVVIFLGAYTRLTHAGLGCPDWPGCYGMLTVPQSADSIAAAEQAFPQRPVEAGKAWNEMIHRYFAGSLGLFIGVIFCLSLVHRKHGAPFFLPLALLVLVVFQAALGMWTVTLKLMPIVVMAHLLGGFTTLALLYLLYLRLNANARGNIVNNRLTSQLTTEPNSRLREFFPLALIALFLLVLQISLGGWTSANYAALTCTELPICQAGWLEKLSWSNSFNPVPPPLDSYEFGFLSHSERLTIHVSHRLGAMACFFYIGWLALSIYRKAQSYYFRSIAFTILALLFAQVILGISNIYLVLPLSVAVSHNLGAALLTLALVTLIHALKYKVSGVCYE
jgi:cytochrome c oxidase assembly protein subunit 15